MDENQNMNNNVIDPNNPYNAPQDPNLNMNQNMYQDPTQMGSDPNMMNQGMYQDPTQMGGDPNMMNQGMFQDPTQITGDPNMMNQGMFQDPTQMAGDPNMMNQGMSQDPIQMGTDPNMMNQGMFQDPNQIGSDPNMMNQGMFQDPNQMGSNPNMMNQGIYQNPNQMSSDPNMMNPGMNQDPNQMSGDPNMMPGMYPDPNQMGTNPNMMNPAMYQDPNQMGFDPNMQGVYQDPNNMGFDPNMMPGMYQDPNSMGFDPNMMGPNPNTLNQNMQLDPSDPNSVINAPVPSAEGPAQTNANFNTDEANFSSPKPKSNKKTILIVGIVLALVVLILIVLIATGVINIGGSGSVTPPVENVVVTPVANQTPTPPAPANEKLNFCDDYYFTYDTSTWTFDQTTSAAGGNQIIQLKDNANHTLKYEINSKPIASLFASYGYDVSTAPGQEALYTGCIGLAQNNCVGQLGTLNAVTDGGFKITNTSQKMYYAYADLPSSTSTTAGELAQDSNQVSQTQTGGIVTRFYFIYLSAETDDVVFFFSLSNLDTVKDANLHQSVLKMLSSIAKNASSVNTNTVGNVSVNDLINNDAATANAILENQVAVDNQNGQQQVDANQQQQANPNQQGVSQNQQQVTQ